MPGPPALVTMASARPRAPAESEERGTSNSSSSVWSASRPPAEQRVDADVARQGAGVRAAARVPAASTAPTLTATIGLLRRPPGDRANFRGLPKLSRYSTITASGVVGPVPEEIVAGHVGLVADRHEAGDPDVELLA